METSKQEPDLTLTSPTVQESPEILAAFARKIEVVQTNFNRPKRSSLIIPAVQGYEKRRGSVSFDKKPAQVVNVGLVADTATDSEEEEVEEEQEQHKNEEDDDEEEELIAKIVVRRECPSSLSLDGSHSGTEGERKYRPATPPPPRRRGRALEDIPLTPPSTPLQTGGVLLQGGVV